MLIKFNKNTCLKYEHNFSKNLIKLLKFYIEIMLIKLNKKHLLKI